MKTTFLRLLLGFYLVSLTGLRVNAHWCGNELTNFEWFCHEGDKHCTCPAGEPEGCCREVNCNVGTNGQQLAQETNIGKKMAAKRVAFARPVLASAFIWEQNKIVASRRSSSYRARAWLDDKDGKLYLRTRRLRT